MLSKGLFEIIAKGRARKTVRRDAARTSIYRLKEYEDELGIPGSESAVDRGYSSDESPFDEDSNYVEGRD